MALEHRPGRNRLFAALTSADHSLLASHLKELSLKLGSLLQEAGKRVEHIYFPHQGMISLLAVMSDGQGIETATVGSEDVVGAMSGFGSAGLYESGRPGTPSRGQLPLAGKSVLIIEDEPLIAMSVEFCLQDAGVAVVKIANSIASAKSILDEGSSFDVAVVELLLADGNASSLVQALSERGIAVVITTGDLACRSQPAHSKAITVLQKPHTESDFINAIQKATVAAFRHRRASGLVGGAGRSVPS